MINEKSHVGKSKAMKKMITYFKNLSIVVKFTLIIILAFILLSGSILISANLYEKERLAT